MRKGPRHQSWDILEKAVLPPPAPSHPKHEHRDSQMETMGTEDPWAQALAAHTPGVNSDPASTPKSFVYQFFADVTCLTFRTTPQGRWSPHDLTKETEAHIGAHTSKLEFKLLVTPLDRRLVPQALCTSISFICKRTNNRSYFPEL